MQTLLTQQADTHSGFLIELEYEIWEIVRLLRAKQILVLIGAMLAGAFVGKTLFDWTAYTPVSLADFPSSVHEHAPGQVYYRPSREIARQLGYLLASAQWAVFFYGLALPLSFGIGFCSSLAGPPRRGELRPLGPVRSSLALAVVIVLLLIALLGCIGGLSLRELIVIRLANSGIVPRPPHPIYIVSYLLLLICFYAPAGLLMFGAALGPPARRPPA